MTSAEGEQPLPAGTPVTFQRVSGHRDGNATACPGDVLYALLPDLRIRAAQYAGPLAGAHPARRLDEAARRHVGGSERCAALRRRQLARRRAGRHPLRGVAARPSRRSRPSLCAPTGSGAPRSTSRAPGTIQARFPGDATRAPLESRHAGDHGRARARDGGLVAADPAPPARRGQRRRDARSRRPRRRVARAQGGPPLPPRAPPPARALRNGRYLSFFRHAATRPVPRDGARARRVGAALRARGRAEQRAERP